MTSRQSIPAFLGGISQQSRAIRSSNLVDDCVNIEHLPSEGATKRYPTEHVAALEEDPSGFIPALSQSQTHAVPMSRDEGDFIVVVDGSLADAQNSVRVYDSAGVAQDLTEVGDAFGYVRGAGHTDLTFQQVADTLYVVNKTVTVGSAPGKDYAPWRQQGDAGVFVKSTAYDHTYELTVGATTVSVTTQATPNTLGGLGYSGSTTNASAQPYRLTAGQADGTDPIFVDALQTSARSNSIADFDCRKIDPSRIFVGATRPGGYAVWMDAQPASGQPTASTWETNYASGFGIDPFDVAAFDPDFQALYLDPAENHSAGDWIAVSRLTITNESQIRPEYVARTLANALVVADPTIVVEDAYMTLPTSEAVESSSFFLTTGAASTSVPRLTVEDSGSNPVEDYAYLWVDEIEDITHLPVFFKQGAVVRVTGGIGSSADDDYFVQFATEQWATETDSDENEFNAVAYSSLFGRGFWRETAAPGQTTGGFEASTMPHRLQRASDGTWSFQAVTWGQRPAGDNLTNPEPSFSGGRIFDVFYHEDRLGFLSGSHLVMSESGEIENFWRTTVLSLPDSDPIDITLSALQGSALYHAISFNRTLHVFSEDSQAVVSGGEGALSPVTVSAKVTGTYRTSPTVPPITQEDSLFTAYRTGNFMQVREMVSGQYAGDLIAGEVTLAVPRLLPSSVRKVLTGGGGSDLMYLTDDGQMFLYQYLRSGRENVMAAWGRWDLPDGELVDAVRMGDHIYALINRVGLSGTYSCLEKIEVGAGRGDTTTDYKIRADRLRQEPTGTWDFATDTTSFTIGFPVTTDAAILVTADNGGSLEYGAPLTVDSYSIVGDTVTVQGNHAAQPVFIGTSYDSSITMSRPVVQAPSQRGGVSSLVGGNTLVRDVVVSLADTGYLKATVEAVGQTTATEEFLADRMDVGELNPSALASREFLVPIHASSDEFRVTFSNPTALPSTLVNGAWALRFNSRYRQS